MSTKENKKETGKDKLNIAQLLRFVVAHDHTKFAFKRRFRDEQPKTVSAWEKLIKEKCKGVIFKIDK